MGKPKSSTVAKISRSSTKDQTSGDTQKAQDDPVDQPSVSVSRDYEEGFDSAYLRQATKEFANDLEKLRTANDFKGERSIQILVDALRQGTMCFTEEEKQRLT